MSFIVCGSRHWNHPAIVQIVLDGLHAKFGSNMSIIEGCYRGADHLAERWCAMEDVENIHVPAEWDKYPPRERWRAGHERNQRMLDLLVKTPFPAVIAFKDGLHPTLAKGGTEHMLKIAQAAGVKTMVVGTGVPVVDRDRLF